MREFYKCDPDKNNTCSKSCCYQNGGPCQYTSRRSCAALDEKGEPIRGPKIEVR